MIPGQFLYAGIIPAFAAFTPQNKTPRRPLPQIQASHSKSRSCECFDLHNKLVPYAKSWAWQKQIVEKKKELIQRDGDCPDSLIVLQHQSVFTLGTGSDEKYIHFDINDAPFDVFRTERGGEVTYHGPGQLVMYPIINLRNHKMDLHWYLRALEEVVIRVLTSTFSIPASRIEGLTGVWVGKQKLAAIGIRALQWITYHGLALNVTTNLAPFDWIVPCGLRNHKVGSIEELVGEFSSFTMHDKMDVRYIADCDLLLDVAYKSLIHEFSEVFQVDIHQKAIQLSDLETELC